MILMIQSSPATSSCITTPVHFTSDLYHENCIKVSHLSDIDLVVVDDSFGNCVIALLTALWLHRPAFTIHVT
ncbi:uncharacterized protein PHALS_15128 [Plasmopara halstedii]|uniref:Uncharacterized protein n=1 Tax=Plasmopara halstedii TaxID=4781 RepID=A0A0N7L477_PLAHL|nr:uncharacterized protein PHALS_15128 [Plasmopara halstedii]CEG37907.1 hypothetical protein PHALS_15128 [Plasmopara halstedii]|eukprot:XP_024574276.1 hypothetical protein PHALS_15128 [Plasmopara halstedii]